MKRKRIVVSLLLAVLVVAAGFLAYTYQDRLRLRAAMDPISCGIALLDCASKAQQCVTKVNTTINKCQEKLTKDLERCANCEKNIPRKTQKCEDNKIKGEQKYQDTLVKCDTYAAGDPKKAKCLAKAEKINTKNQRKYTECLKKVQDYTTACASKKAACIVKANQKKTACDSKFLQWLTSAIKSCQNKGIACAKNIQRQCGGE